MSNSELKEQLDDELCAFCPWKNGEIDHRCDAQCDGLYCNDAFEVFVDENQSYFDDNAE